VREGQDWAPLYEPHYLCRAQVGGDGTGPLDTIDPNDIILPNRDWGIYLVG